VLNALGSLRKKFISPEHTIYFHAPCFDGLISCALAWDFLESELGWRIRHICPVNYDARSTWLSSNVTESCAVLDFLYHPSAGFWADHHLTTFVSEKAEASYETRAFREPRAVLYNPKCDSTASLLWQSFYSFFATRSNFLELMHWADKIDAARYGSVDEAIFGEAPALRINSSLMHGGPGYCEFLVRQLRDHDLESVADLPEVAQRFEEVRKRLARGLKQLEDRVLLLDDGIVAFDFNKTDDTILSRYAPFHFFPNARYSIGLSRDRDTVRITAMRNPWMTFESIPLGEVFKQCGGGGHQRVASVFLSGARIKSAEYIADQLLNEIRRQDKQSELREAIVA
jgi:hypothetical protein